MREDEAGRAALKALNYDRFVLPDEQHYVQLREVWLAVRERL
jgi:hypothetical protein